MAVYSGKFAQITIGGINLTSTRWTVNCKVDALDITTQKDIGMGRYQGGVMDTDVSFEAFWDGTNNPFNVPDLRPNSTVGPVTIFIDSLNLPNAATNTFIFPELFIESVSTDAEVRGMVKYTVSAKTVDGYTMPGGLAISSPQSRLVQDAVP